MLKGALSTLLITTLITGLTFSYWVAIDYPWLKQAADAKNEISGSYSFSPEPVIKSLNTPQERYEAAISMLYWSFDPDRYVSIDYNCLSEFLGIYRPDINQQMSRIEGHYKFRTESSKGLKQDYINRLELLNGSLIEMIALQDLNNHYPTIEPLSPYFVHQLSDLTNNLSAKEFATKFGNCYSFTPPQT